MKPNNVLVYDIETDSLNTDEANVKWFGCYSYKLKKYFILDYNDIKGIKRLIDSHLVLVGFNNKEYDNKILGKYNINFQFKIVVDLYKICSPKYKNRLAHLGFKLKKHTLNAITEGVGCAEVSKGEIDYNIFKKDSWSDQEKLEIEKYLKQDIILTRRLFEWLDEQHQPLRALLSPPERERFCHINTSVSSLAYRIICNQSGVPVIWANDDEIGERQSFAGGHHILPRWEKVKGNIVYVDFNSAYPHAIIQGNLLSRGKDGWIGDDYFTIDGVYDISKLAKPAEALKKIYKMRLEAKKNKDKIKDAAYKIIINSFYGTIGNPLFKNFYDPMAAADCTSIVRTLLKKCAKTLEENDYKILYGFTDGMFVLIPPESDEEELMIIIEDFIEHAKKHFPFPTNTFAMSVDKRVKFCWFVNKKSNCYLWVNQDDTIEYKSTLLNSTAPELALKVFNEYISPRIIKELDVNFTEKEIETEVRKYLKEDIHLIAQEYKVKEKENYKVKTSMQYQIAETYGAGNHKLIPNVADVGIGRGKSTLKTKAIRYCSFEEFENKNLTIDDISLKNVMRYLKPFHE